MRSPSVLFFISLDEWLAQVVSIHGRGQLNYPPTGEVDILLVEQRVFCPWTPPAVWGAWSGGARDYYSIDGRHFMLIEVMYSF